MIKKVFEILGRPKDPVYIEYMSLLKSGPVEFNDGHFLATRVDGSVVKVTLPEYVNIERTLIDCSPTPSERIKLEYIKTLMRKQQGKNVARDMATLKKAIKEAKDTDKIGAIKEFQAFEHDQKLGMYSDMYYIKSLPTIVKSSAQIRKKVKGKGNAKVKVRNEKVKAKVIGNMLLQYPFNLFNFTSKKECESREISKPYYISKKEMVDVIAGNDDMKKLFPKGFKSLKKEQLCDLVFKKSDE